MSRQTENAGFFARFLRKSNHKGAEEIPNHISPPGLDIFARYRTSNCTWPLRGKICLLWNFPRHKRLILGLPSGRADSSQNSDIFLLLAPKSHIAEVGMSGADNAAYHDSVTQQGGYSNSRFHISMKKNEQLHLGWRCLETGLRVRACRMI